ncbi:hypothetical protein KAX17_07120 [Candidatus Bipolaricaulota bacterium]|nr:hypothetical protein [Candidatus Bipolaricaulota bacterium]
MDLNLRDFLYLDTRLVRSYLSSVEGGLYDEETVTEKSETEAGGGLSVGTPFVSVGGKGSKTTGIEVTRQTRMTDEGLFGRLFARLEEAGAQSEVETLESTDWEAIGRRAVFEVAVTPSFSKVSGFAGAIDAFLPLADVYEAATGESPFDDTARRAIDGIRLLEKTQSSRGIPCLFSVVGHSDRKLIALLSPQWLRVETRDFVGELFLYTKVQRKLLEGETFDLFNPLEDLQRIPLNREQRRKLKTDTQMPEELRDAVEGPALVVTPIAVYR